MRKRQIEVAGKTYTLTVKRKLIFKMQELCPELLKIRLSNREYSLDDEIDASIKLSGSIDEIFYNMIIIEHPEITREKSDEIYEKFVDEYEDVEQNLLNFIYDSFTNSIPTENKKKLNW